MTYSDIPSLVTGINTLITTNGTRDITGAELHDILIGITSLLSPTLAAQLTAALGVPVGGAVNGQVFNAGDTLESVLRKILIQTISPTYVVPTIVLSTNNPTLNNEVGTVISPQFSVVFTQNDGGGIVSSSLKKNGTQISTSLPYTDGSVTLSGSAVVYQASITYAQGACKLNNLGNTDCTGRIVAGTVSSNTITYNSYRKVFWGTPSLVPASSADIRALTGNTLNPLVGSQFTINIPIGSVRVVFAYPATLEDVASVKYVELANSEVSGNFSITTLTVNGASGFTAVSYKVFTYTPVEPFPTAATYLVTI